MKLLALAVEGAGQRYHDDDQNRQVDSPAICQAKVFPRVVRVVRFSHQCTMTSVGVRVRIVHVSSAMLSRPYMVLY